MAERLGNQAINQKVAGLIPGRENDVVSLGKALPPTCLGGLSLYLMQVALDKSVCKISKCDLKIETLCQRKMYGNGDYSLK